MRNNISKLILLGILSVNAPAFAVPEPIERPTPGPTDKTDKTDKTMDVNKGTPPEVRNDQRPIPTPTEGHPGENAPKGDVPHNVDPGTVERSDGRGDKH